MFESWCTMFSNYKKINNKSSQGNPSKVEGNIYHQCRIKNNNKARPDDYSLFLEEIINL